MLGDPRMCECLMLSAPTRKVQRLPNTLLVYLIMMIFALLLTVFFTFPYISSWAAGLNFAFFFLTFFFFTCAACMKPGYIENDQVDFMDMLNLIDSTQLCPDCSTIRTSRSRHCSVCGHCVERFDHHCPWINNCVGVGNHNAFFLYLTFQTLVVYTTFGISLTAFVRYLTHNDLDMSKFNHKIYDIMP
mmetsp:Transcript_20655/g.25326  ORF Transcript_20655/g.25326 Transcript_20655/m.25326 type:complete len:188 (-) Transcript_20655:951-1514(-)